MSRAHRTAGFIGPKLLTFTFYRTDSLVRRDVRSRCYDLGTLGGKKKQYFERFRHTLYNEITKKNTLIFNGFPDR